MPHPPTCSCRACIGTRMHSRGLVPCRDWRRTNLTANTSSLVLACQTFHLPFEMVITRSSHAAPELWTTPEGLALLRAIDAASRTLVYVSFPAVVRRLADRHDLLEAFASAKALDAPAEALKEILRPIAKDPAKTSRRQKHVHIRPSGAGQERHRAAPDGHHTRPIATSKRP